MLYFEEAILAVFEGEIWLKANGQNDASGMEAITEFYEKECGLRLHRYPNHDFTYPNHEDWKKTEHAIAELLLLLHDEGAEVRNVFCQKNRGTLVTVIKAEIIKVKIPRKLAP